MEKEDVKEAAKQVMTRWQKAVALADKHPKTAGVIFLVYSAVLVFVF